MTKRIVWDKIVFSCTWALMIFPFVATPLLSACISAVSFALGTTMTVYAWSLVAAVAFVAGVKLHNIVVEVVF
jgi:hypothetical protein